MISGPQQLPAGYLTPELPLSDAPSSPMAHLALHRCTLSLCPMSALLLLGDLIIEEERGKMVRGNFNFMSYFLIGFRKKKSSMSITSVLPPSGCDRRARSATTHHVPGGILYCSGSVWGGNGEQEGLWWETCQGTCYEMVLLLRQAFL